MLREYVRFGDALCSPESTFTLKGVCVVDIKERIAGILSNVRCATAEAVRPRVVIPEGMPRLYRRGLNVTRAIELVIRTLLAYQQRETAAIEVGLEPSSQHERGDCELALLCKGARFEGGIDIPRFE